jgi:hypothetical protein
MDADEVDRDEVDVVDVEVDDVDVDTLGATVVVVGAVGGVRVGVVPAAVTGGVVSTV